jgi:hypothetical protein
MPTELNSLRQQHLNLNSFEKNKPQFKIRFKLINAFKKRFAKKKKHIGQKMKR